MSIRAKIICTLVAILYLIPSGSSTAQKSTSVLFTQTTQFVQLAWLTGGERFPAGATIFVLNGQQKFPLIPSFFATADPNVSFDGGRILFAGKKLASDPWQLWEFDVHARAARLISSGSEDLVRPMYLPDDRILYSRKHDGNFILETAGLDGSTPQPLFFVPGSALATDVLLDGRILFQAAYPLGTSGTPELYTVYSDGSGVESYRCDHGHSRFSGKQLASGDILFTTGSQLGKFTSPLAHDVSVPSVKGEYAGEIAETSSGNWLFSWRANSSRYFNLRQQNKKSRVASPFFAVRGKHLVQPTLLASRPIPKRHPSALHDWQTANLLTLNTYTSKYKIAVNSVASVQMYTQEHSGHPKLLGSAPVEKDGSFYLKVPGDQPLRFALLDASGKTIKQQEGWFWARKGEQRVCVGCHSGPETAPDNAVPAILLRSTVPADLTGSIQSSSAGGH